MLPKRWGWVPVFSAWEMEAGTWSKSVLGQQPLGNCPDKFPENPFIYWPNPAWQHPYSLKWDSTRWPVKVHSTPKPSNIAHFPVKLFTAADQVSASFSLMLVYVVKWAQGGKVGAQYVLGDLRHLCREGWQDPGETWSSSWRPDRLSTASEMMAEELQTNPT